jgi:hypothetical protein
MNTGYDFSGSNWGGYDQIYSGSVGPDSFDIIASHQLANAVERRLATTPPEPPSTDPQLARFIRDKVRQEIEKHELSKAKYTGPAHTEGMSAYPSTSCACSAKKSWDDPLVLLLFIVVIVFIRLQSISAQVQGLHTASYSDRGFV